VLITSIAESAPNPIRATLPATIPAPIAITASTTFHGEVLKPKGTTVQSDAAFRRGSDHDHLGYGDWSMSDKNRLAITAPHTES
jgi:hypothetical protein